jgi:hypothetical protein
MSRHFQFHLRTLMIGVTLFCVVAGSYFGWQRNTVLDRQRERKWLESQGAVILSKVMVSGKEPYYRSVSWLRGMLGDSAVAAILVPKHLSNDDEQRFRAAFPEAVEIFTIGHWHGK